MSEIINLSCPSCGGKLKITEDIDQFACAHCGNEHQVKRFGNTVSLAPLVDQLRKVQEGIDKTVSELAIERVEREIEELEQQYAALWDERAKISGIFFFMKKREIESISKQMEQIMTLAKKKQADLKIHQSIVNQ